MKIFNNPQINTIANASCQEKPKPNTTVNVKNAFNPIPGANA